MRTPRHWLAVLGLVCALVGMVRSAAVPTESMVVTKTEEDVTSKASVSTETEPTTEEPLRPIKLTEMEVTSKISSRYAHTAVVAQFKNPGKKAQEAHFRILLPETAFISGFIMTINGTSYKAYVKEKEEAKQIYQDAVSHGQTASYVGAKARDSNHFVVTLNMEPFSAVVFNLTYEELLVRRNGVYNHAINMHPGTLVPKLKYIIQISESEKITELRVPEIRTGNEIDATKDDPQNTKAVIERGHDDREATVTFTPDLEEQKRLMQIYSEKAKESASHINSFSFDDNKVEGVLGQFVVQYDVDRTKEGDILVNDGYFVHFFAPKDLPVLNKYVIFVLDTSGSMMGHKIDQLKEAMMTILSDLNERDYFSLVEFASVVKVHDLKEADQEPPKRNYYYYEDYSKPTVLVPPSQATPENISKAKVIVSRLDAIGGTNIGEALNVAVSLNNKRFGNLIKDKVNSTSAAPEETSEVPTTESAKTEVVTLSSTDYESVKALEAIIIFLTDGDPTVGETNPSRIITHLSEKNFGPQKATIFSLAFGEDADRKFLRKISLRNDGFMRHIYEGADAPLQLRDFYRQVSSPLLTNVKFTYPSDQVKTNSVTKDEFRAFFDGSEVVVAGKLSESATELTTQLSGFCGVLDDGNARKKYEKNIKVPISSKKHSYLPLERLWAYLSIKQLLDQKDAVDESDTPVDKEDTPEKKALKIALKYEFVTPLTSLVVVKPNMTSAVDTESVDDKKQYDSFGLPGAAGVPLSGLAYPASFSAVPQSISHNLFAIQPASAPHYFTPISSPTDAYRRTALFSSRSSNHGTQIWSNPMHYRHDAPVPDFSLQSLSGFKQPVLRTETSRIVGNVDHTRFESALTTTTQPIYTTTDVSAISLYHLENFDWVESILDSANDALVLELNQTVTLKLTKDTIAPKSSGGDVDCGNAVNGSDGVCVYLTRCDSAKSITVDEYKSKYCLVEQVYAGVCCPKTHVN